MTKIKFCGLKRACEIEWVNELKPDYIGFVFSKKSRRYVNPGEAGKLKAMLHSSIKAVGVFVDAKPEVIVGMAELEVIDSCFSGIPYYLCGRCEKSRGKQCRYGTFGCWGRLWRGL